MRVTTEKHTFTKRLFLARLSILHGGYCLLVRYLEAATHSQLPHHHTLCLTQVTKHKDTVPVGLVAYLLVTRSTGVKRSSRSSWSLSKGIGIQYSSKGLLHTYKYIHTLYRRVYKYVCMCISCEDFRNVNTP